MSTIISYLTFNGNCREAMTFYQKCLGGELTLQTIGDSPLAGKMPGKMKDCILHATLSNGNLLLMGSDMVPENGLIKGNSVSLTLACGSEKEIKTCYKNLAAGGISSHPLENSFWGALFGGLTDKYGVSWLLNYTRVKTIKNHSK
jgi:PhnB protein